MLQHIFSILKKHPSRSPLMERLASLNLIYISSILNFFSYKEIIIGHSGIENKT